MLKGGIIFEINQTAARALGYKLQEMIGHPFTDFVEPEDRARFTERHRKIVDAGEHQAYEIKLRKKDGSFLIANMHSEPLANPEGVVSAVATVTMSHWSF